MKKSITVLLSVVTVLFLIGCSVRETSMEKIKDLKYTVVSAQDLPEEITQLIGDNKSTQMKLTFTDKGNEYVIVGYGTQKTSGYSVEVLEVYEAENVIVVDTNLLGPGPEEETSQVATFPYVVILMEENEKPVVFE